ncbi:uncharacterized protein LOC131144640 isoform X2 [Malania oleifera]|uniref:uncharacterized protein LOC131144640 isoform X2 n=1 Tax=Malania oleifera TaxID=397392 RepID=UPI0025AEAD31|nr:uncharacterized protein LOC131144640 isoform X2 [Malania oleifera]
MEELKSVVPDGLKQMVADSTRHDLPRTCSSLFDFFLRWEPFHRIVNDLVDPNKPFWSKNKEAALDSKQKGNQCFFRGDYANALNCYSQALRVAPVDAADMNKNLVATLYVNRASVLHKMNLFKECIRDCSRALQISPSYAKAWYRRGKANASLGKFEDAVHDLTVAKDMELSMGGKKQIESEKNIMLDHYGRTSSSPVQCNEKLEKLDEQLQIRLRCVTTPSKGRGMVSPCNIPPASLVHSEEPYAAIILKHCRETHCHYCFNDLPPDNVPCALCSIPLYCSQHCLIQAGGQMSKNYQKNYDILKNQSNELKNHIANVTLADDPECAIEHISEHEHECNGVHWPAVLPAEIVLAGRVLVKSIKQHRGSTDIANLTGVLELCDNYEKMPPGRKLELHIYSIVLLCCLRTSCSIEIPINGSYITQIVILICQIRVNSMTIVRMKLNDVPENLDYGTKISCSGGALTSNVEQVRVGQAIYRDASLFNHSCQPNIHAYFVSRTIFVRTIEFVAAESPVEISYGPQVGLWNCKSRLKFLEDEYSFQCQCCACSEANLSDLVLKAFHCVNPNCLGIVLNSSVVNCEAYKIKCFLRSAKECNLIPNLEVRAFNDIHNTAHCAFMQSTSSLNIDPGYCLKCGSYCNVKSSDEASNEAWMCIRRLQDAIVLKEISSTTLSEALRSLALLRSTLHAFNKRIAEAEDNVAQAFCMVGELRSALDHCKESIKILERLYGPNDITIGYELVKLASIQLSMGDSTASVSVDRMSEIFSCFYGSHADTMFPYLQHLKEETCRLVR